MINKLIKPENPEELYEFFVQGMPLKPIEYDGYCHTFRRKGWNIYTRFIQCPLKEDNEIIRLEFYSVMKAYYADWILGAYKYEIIKTK